MRAHFSAVFTGATAVQVEQLVLGLSVSTSLDSASLSSMKDLASEYVEKEGTWACFFSIAELDTLG